MAKNLEVIEKNAETENLSKIEGLVDAIDAIVSNLTMLDKEMATIINYAESVQSEYNNIMKNARSAKASMQKYKESFNGAKEEAEKLIQAKKVELQKQGSKVDSKLLQKYKQKANDSKKVIVPLVNGKCGGCSINLSAGNLNVLKTKKVIECENCGRIIYIED